MAILTLAEAKTYLRIDGTDFDADVQRAMASAEAMIRSGTGRTFDSTNPIAVECALMLTSNFYDNRGGVQETRLTALDYGITNLLHVLENLPVEGTL